MLACRGLRTIRSICSYRCSGTSRSATYTFAILNRVGSHGAGNMNIFRLVGDLSHLLAIILLLIKIWKTRSCAGIYAVWFQLSWAVNLTFNSLQQVWFWLACLTSLVSWLFPVLEFDMSDDSVLDPSDHSSVAIFRSRLPQILIYSI